MMIIFKVFIVVVLVTLMLVELNWAITQDPIALNREKFGNMLTHLQRTFNVHQSWTTFRLASLFLALMYGASIFYIVSH
jgi:ABC-type enterobactin transport system permease subunit